VSAGQDVRGEALPNEQWMTLAFGVAVVARDDEATAREIAARLESWLTGGEQPYRKVRGLVVRAGAPSDRWAAFSDDELRILHDAVSLAAHDRAAFAPISALNSELASERRTRRAG
jgi:hypothetical protein